jgi:hypothetical protein
LDFRCGWTITFIPLITFIPFGRRSWGDAYRRLVALNQLVREVDIAADDKQDE